MQLEIVTPESLLFSKDTTMIVIPGSEGDFGVLNNHSPIISSIRMGTVKIYDDNNITKEFFVTSGFAEVTGERCTILADFASDLSLIDRKEIEQKLVSIKEEIDTAIHDEQKTSAINELHKYKMMLAALDLSKVN